MRVRLHCLIMIFFYFTLSLLFAKLISDITTYKSQKLPDSQTKEALVDDQGKLLTLRLTTKRNYAKIKLRKKYTQPVTPVMSLSEEEIQQSREIKPHDSLNNKLKYILRCRTGNLVPKTKIYGEYFVLANYIKAEYEVKCYESITFATHASANVLNMLPALVNRWLAPVSITLLVNMETWTSVLHSVLYLRQCTDEAHLIRKYVTFHVIFHRSIVENGWEVPSWRFFKDQTYMCRRGPPKTGTALLIESALNESLYPISTARVASREASQTHFVLSAEINFLPSANMVPMFLNLIGKYEKKIYKNSTRKVFAVNSFGLKHYTQIPSTMSDLKEMFKDKNVLLLESSKCPYCSDDISDWLHETTDAEMTVLRVIDTTNKDWMPIFIGSKHMPAYSDSLIWTAESDTKILMYTLCLLDYEFVILKNAFMVESRPHRQTNIMTFLREKKERNQAVTLAGIKAILENKFGKKDRCLL